jgi:UDP-N-acetylglucosamine 1-carboxyvinyltransferase
VTASNSNSGRRRASADMDGDLASRSSYSRRQGLDALELEVVGGVPLVGRMTAPAGKWYTAHAIVASLIAECPVTLRRVPDSLDTAVWIDLLNDMGASCRFDASSTSLLIDARNISRAPSADLAGSLRASIELLAPLTTRLTNFRLGFPGGDRIGPRPINGQVQILQAFGAQVDIEDGEIVVECGRFDRRRERWEIELARPQISVAIMATILAAGLNIPARVTNVPGEPEVKYHCGLLEKLGFPMESQLGPYASENWLELGRRTSRPFHCDITLAGDPTWATTFAVAAALTDGNIVVDGVDAGDFGMTLPLLRQLGVLVDHSNTEHGGCLSFSRGDAARFPGAIVADYFPAVSTDHLPFITLLACSNSGETVLMEDRIFKARDNHFGELRRMGADIRPISGSSRFTVTGSNRFGAAVGLQALDIRAGMALAIAAASATGRSTIKGLSHIARGYPCVGESIARLGGEARLVPLNTTRGGK